MADERFRSYGFFSRSRPAITPRVRVERAEL
jgi:hypothetical protein